MKMSGPRSHSGLTLVEMLVCVAILAILGVISFGALKGVRSSSSKTKSIQNLRLIGMGISMYTSERGHLPESGQWATFGNVGGFWYDAVSFYLDGPSPEFQMISGRWQRKPTYPAWTQDPARRFETLSPLGYSVAYGWNFQSFGLYILNQSFGYAIRPTQAEIPSETIIVGTNREFDTGGNPIGPDNAQNPLIYPYSPYSVRFSGAGLYLMLDGRVKELTPAEALARNSYYFWLKK